MGYDITFHPVSAAAAQYFVFEVVENPSLADGRAAELTRSPELREKARGLYRDLLGFRDPAAWPRDAGFGGIISYFTAIYAGFLHPYWYARQAAIAWLGKYDESVLRLFQSWRRIAGGYVARLRDDSLGLLGLNHTGSGYITPAGVLKLEKTVRDMMVVREDRPYLDKLSDPASAPVHHVFDDAGLAALLRAIEYAKAGGLGLMEATEVVKSVGGAILLGTASDPAQFRSALTDNLDDVTNRREV
jgi:hypothetical protein